MSEQFEREVIDRLARIETTVTNLKEDHKEVKAEIKRLQEANSERKKAARSSAAFWGTGAGAAVYAAAEAVGKLFP